VCEIDRGIDCEFDWEIEWGDDSGFDWGVGGYWIVFDANWWINIS